jgi:hypothetical protein
MFPKLRPEEGDMGSCLKYYRYLVLLVLFGCHSGALPAQEAPGADPIYTALRELGLDGRRASVQNLVLKRESATITFEQGQIFSLREVQGRVTGAVFIGRGQFEIVPRSRVEQFHLGHLSGQPFLADSFERMVMRFTDTTFDEFQAEAQFSEGPEDRTAAGLLQDQRKLFKKEKNYSSPNVAIYLQNRNIDARILLDYYRPENQGFFLATFKGRQHGDLLFGVDPLGQPFVSPEEVVLAGLADANLGIWVSEELAAEQRQSSENDNRLIDIEHYKIDASAEGKRLEAVVTISFTALQDDLGALPFDLFPTLRVSEIRQGEESLVFVQEDKKEDADLYVILRERLRKGGQYELTFKYRGDDALHDSGGGNYTLVARTNWFPANVQGYDRATFDMTLRCGRNQTMVATGKLVSETNEAKHKVTRWRSDFPIKVAGFNFGRFNKVSGNEPNSHQEIETYANREIPDYLRAIQRTGATLGALNTTSMIKKVQADAMNAFGIYSTFFGALPYGRLAMSQQPAISYGQAWPMLIYMPLSAFLDATFRHELGLSGSREARSFYRYVAAHEVAHQWWGHLVGWKSYRDQWLSEGLAEFSASIYAQRIYGNKDLVQFWKEHRENLLMKNQFGYSSVAMGGPIMGYRLQMARRGNFAGDVIYSKGAFIIQMLRMLMWDPQQRDERFFGVLEDFAQTYANLEATTEDFKKTVEKHMTPTMDLDGNRRMDWFFNQFVYGTAVPEYSINYSTAPAEDGKTRLTFRVTQSGVGDNFKMRVPVYIEMGGGMHRLGSMTLFGNSTSEEFSVIVPSAPSRMVVNGNEDILCVMK